MAASRLRYVPLAYLRGDEFLKGGWQFYGVGRHGLSSIGDTRASSNQSRHRGENVAFDAFSCATVRVSSEGGPAKWLKNKNLSNHPRDFEPGGRRFESVRARFSIKVLTAVEHLALSNIQL